MTNAPGHFAQFFYRANPDKTLETICSHCFAGSAPMGDKSGLQAWEATHRCSHWLQQTA